MKSLINHLIQLQELTLIRDEQKVASKGQHLQQLDASIKAMTNKLPDDTRAEYLKLHKRDPIVLSAVSNSHCSVCGMQLAISFTQAVRLAREILFCPNCARMLYYPTAPVRGHAAKQRRTAPRKVGIMRFSSKSLMVPNLSATNKDDAIKELGLTMATEGFVDNGKTFVEEALRREAILSTSVEHGLAFPHVRGVEGGGLALALGTSAKGIAWGDAKSEPSKIIFMIAIPIAASAFYLKLLAGLAETFIKAENRKAILAPKDPEELWKTLTKITRTTIK
ncbi:MAG: PTS sugar transporter subunit IIA [Verrucomicrobia bacterium]|nr:PTS sugar transporter subunit IIA [Verrucomicrobiota bacterium]